MLKLYCAQLLSNTSPAEAARHEGLRHGGEVHHGLGRGADQRGHPGQCGLALLIALAIVYYLVLLPGRGRGRGSVVVRAGQQLVAGHVVLLPPLEQRL